MIVAGTVDGVHIVGGGCDRPGWPVRALAATPAGLWAASGDHVWCGDTDHELPHPVGCLLEVGDGVLAGTTPPHLFRLGSDGRPPEQVESFDRVDGQEEWHQPFPAPPDARSMARGADGTLYVNVHVGGIVRSRDGGESWQPTIDVHDDVHQVAVHPERPSLVLAPCHAGLAVSEDGGDTWGIDTDGLHAAYCRAVAVGGEMLLVSASRGPRGQQAAVYRRPAAGRGRFERCVKGLPEWFADNVDTFCFGAADGLFVIGSSDGSVYTSSDEGGTWELAAEGLPGIRCILATIP